MDNNGKSEINRSHNESHNEMFLDNKEIDGLNSSVKACLHAIHDLRDRFIGLHLTKEESEEIKVSEMLEKKNYELIDSLDIETKELIRKDKKARAPGLAFELLTRDGFEDDEDMYQLSLASLATDYCSRHYPNKNQQDLLKDQKALTEIGEYIIDYEELNARDQLVPYTEARYKYERSLDRFYTLCTKLYSRFADDESIELLYIDDPYIDIGFSEGSNEDIIIHYSNEDSLTYINGFKIKNREQKYKAEYHLVIISKIIDQLEKDLPPAE